MIHIFLSFNASFLLPFSPMKACPLLSFMGFFAENYLSVYHSSIYYPLSHVWHLPTDSISAKPS